MARVTTAPTFFRRECRTCSRRAADTPIMVVGCALRLNGRRRHVWRH